MTINVKNGEFQFNKWILSPEDVLNEIKNKFSSNEFELRLKNDQWATYRLNISEEYIINIFFLNEKIEFIEIYPKNITEDKIEHALQIILKDLDGVKNYSWGKVELNVDNKSGYKSIVIRYH